MLFLFEEEREGGRARSFVSAAIKLKPGVIARTVSRVRARKRTKVNEFLPEISDLQITLTNVARASL